MLKRSSVADYIFRTTDADASLKKAEVSAVKERALYASFRLLLFSQGNFPAAQFKAF